MLVIAVLILGSCGFLCCYIVKMFGMMAKMTATIEKCSESVVISETLPSGTMIEKLVAKDQLAMIYNGEILYHVTEKGSKSHSDASSEGMRIE